MDEKAPRVGRAQLRPVLLAQLALAILLAGVLALGQEQAAMIEEFDVPPGSRPHDVAPAPDGTVWYTAQDLGELGQLDPADGATHHIRLGEGSRPHGVIVGPEGDAWVTDGGQNAIVRVDAQTEAVSVYPLPLEWPTANLNTAAFDAEGRLWFTGHTGLYGNFDPASETMEIFRAPQGRGPYGIAATPAGDIYFASLAGSYVARIDTASGEAEVLEPPTPDQGARRVWSDSGGRIWVAEWNAGAVGRYDPATDDWREWPLPGEEASPYAVYVDDADDVWLTDFGGDTLWRFDPDSETFERYELPTPGSQVRQLLGRPGEVWGAGSATDTLFVVRLPRDRN